MGGGSYLPVVLILRFLRYFGRTAYSILSTSPKFVHTRVLLLWYSTSADVSFVLFADSEPSESFSPGFTMPQHRPTNEEDEEPNR